MKLLCWIGPDDPVDAFPPVESALDQPPGLLAAGGDLGAARLLAAYRRGIFPWYESGQPILWWCPDPRAVLVPGQMHVSRSLRRTLRSGVFRTSVDSAFGEVIDGCAAERPGQRGTWITPQLNAAYRLLHELGAAHSIETWDTGRLVGGLYGVAIGSMFFAESMFSRESDASKVALHRLVTDLVAWGYPLIDCQIMSPHLASLGATTMPRAGFVNRVAQLCERDPDAGAWQQPPAGAGR